MWSQYTIQRIITNNGLQNQSLAPWPKVSTAVILLSVKRTDQRLFAKIFIVKISYKSRVLRNLKLFAIGCDYTLDVDLRISLTEPYSSKFLRCVCNNWIKYLYNSINNFSAYLTGLPRILNHIFIFRVTTGKQVMFYILSKMCLVASKWKLASPSGFWQDFYWKLIFIILVLLSLISLIQFSAFCLVSGTKI